MDDVGEGSRTASGSRMPRVCWLPTGSGWAWIPLPRSISNTATCAPMRAPDGVIDLRDILMVTRKAPGLASF